MMHRRVAGSLLVVSLVGLLAGVRPSEAQSEDPLLKNSKDPKKIALQIRSAMPMVERGYAMLTSTTDPEPTEAAVKLLLKSYRYLRAAYDSNGLILSISRVPDPMLEIQNRQIMFVRQRLLDCTGHREYIMGGPARTKCLDGLASGLRTLRTVVATIP
jgi:hypothetical protein